MNTAVVRRCAGFASLALGVFVLFFSLSANQVSGEGVLLTTATPVPTRVPLPIAPETLNEAQELMLSNGGCQLPCFWGFRPGYTTAEEIFAFVQPEGDYSNVGERYGLEYYFTRVHERDWTVSILFTIQDDVLSVLDVTLHEPSEWLPPETLELRHLLSEMTEIPEAYLFVNTGQQRIFLTLVYDETGVVAEYPFSLRVQGGVLSPDIDKPLLLCPYLRLNDYINFWFQDGNGRELFEEYFIGFEPGADSDNRHWTVERMTGLDTQSFIEQIIANPNRCVEMLSYPELIEQGYGY